MSPNQFDPLIYRSPDFIRQITDFEHLKNDQSELIISTILSEFCFNDKSVYYKNSKRYIIGMMFDVQGKPKRQLQSITSRIIIERIKTKIDKYLIKAPGAFASLVSILAHSAISNPPIIQQCTKLINVEKVKILLDKSSSRYDVVLSLLEFFTYVYVFNKESDLPSKDLISILQIIQRYVVQAKEKLKELTNIGLSGQYEQVFPKNDPSLVDFMQSTSFNYNQSLEFWKLISQGDHWETQYGILIILVEMCQSSDEFNFELVEKVSSIIDELRLLQQEIYTYAIIKDRLNFSTLQQCLKKSIDSLGKFIKVYQDFDKNLHDASCAVLDTLGSRRKALCLNGLERNISEDQKPLDLFATIFSTKSWSKIVQAVVRTRDEQLNSKFKMFWNVFYDNFPTSSFLDNIEENVIEIPIVQELMNNPSQETVKRLENIVYFFRNNKERAILYQILKAAIPENVDQHRIFAKIYFKAGIIEMAVKSLISKQNVNEQYQAILLLNKAFDNPTPKIRLRFLSWLSETEMYYPFFLFISEELTSSKNRILMQYRAEKANDTKTGYFELLNCFAAISIETEKHLYVSNETKQILLETIQFMQICCDNCWVQFQNFMRTQAVTDGRSRSEVNLFETMCSYLIFLYETYDFILYSKELRDAMSFSITTLIDFVTGPCIENQTCVGKSPQLLEYFDYLIGLFGEVIFDNEDEYRDDYILLYRQCVLMLLTLVEGSPDEKVLSNLQIFLNYEKLVEQTTNIYEKLIKYKSQRIRLNRTDYMSSEDNDIIKAGVDIIILLLKVYPNRQIETDAYKSYYKQNIGYVELLKNNAIESHYFEIPAKCKLLTKDTKRRIVQRQRQTHNQRLEDFIKQSILANSEMDHQLTIHNREKLNKISKLWKVYGIISFILICVINFYILFTEPSAQVLKLERDEEYDPFQPGLKALGLLQTFFAVIELGFKTYEYYPVTIHRYLVSRKDYAEYEIANFFEMSNNESICLRSKHNKKRKSKPNLHTQYANLPIVIKLYNLCWNKKAVGDIGFIAFSWIAFTVAPFFYAILLLDIFRRSPDLFNILRSITTNRYQLLYTLILTLIAVYIFAMWGYVFLAEFYVGADEDALYDSEFYTYCDSIWDWFVSTLHQGLRLGGGIGEGLGKVPIEEDKYTNRIIFDLLFFIIMIIILLNIVFGIIIDTFAELRDNRKQQSKQLNTIWFICGVDRLQIERYGKGWSYHFMAEHNPFAYLAFIIYVKEKPINDCSGLEKFVMECLENNDISFFPNKTKDGQVPDDNLLEQPDRQQQNGYHKRRMHRRR